MVGAASPGLMVLNAIRKQAEQAGKQQSLSILVSRFQPCLSSFLPWLLSKHCDSGHVDQINPSLPCLFSALCSIKATVTITETLSTLINGKGKKSHNKDSCFKTNTRLVKMLTCQASSNIFFTKGLHENASFHISVD